MTGGERRSAYACDITYATANEIGFDFLRDQLALHLQEQVHRPFNTVVIDEVDSILIDEARIPLVIPEAAAMKALWLLWQIVWCVPFTAAFTTASIPAGRNVGLTDEGIRAVENATGCPNLYNERNLVLLTRSRTLCTLTPCCIGTSITS